MERERKLMYQGLLSEKQTELDMLETKFGRLRTELNRLINPFEPLEHQLRVIDIEAIEQAVREMREAKTIYDLKLREIQNIKKELGT